MSSHCILMNTLHKRHSQIIACSTNGSADVIGQSESSACSYTLPNRSAEGMSWCLNRGLAATLLGFSCGRRVAIVTLHVAEQCSNKSFQMSHAAVPRKRTPLEECIRIGSVKCTKSLQAFGKSSCVSGCQPCAYRGKRKTRSSSRCRPLNQPPMSNFDHEDDDTQYEDDASQNDAWQGVFDLGDEVQRSSLHPRLGAASVYKWHRIFHHKGVLVCVKCGGWINRKLRHDCPGNPSKLGIEASFKEWRNAKDHGWDKSGPSPSTERRQLGWWWRDLERDRGTSCRVRSRMALWVGGLGQGLGGERVLPSGGATLPPGRRVCVGSTSVFLQCLF